MSRTQVRFDLLAPRPACSPWRAPAFPVVRQLLMLVAVQLMAARVSVAGTAVCYTSVLGVWVLPGL